MRNRTLILSTILFSGAFLAAAQTPAPPQRTMVSRPENAAPADSSETSSVAMEKYREMWNKMSPAQRQAFVSAGGSTPEQYERSLQQHGSGFVAGGAAGAQPAGERSRKAPDSGNPVDSNAFDSLSKSLQDLSSVRDGNLWRVQKDGCPPEIASRMADLRGKLETYEIELNGAESSASAASSPSSKEERSSADRLAIAADWFKNPADKEASTASAANGGNSRESKLLEAALAGNGSAAAPQSHIDPKSPEAERARKAAEEDIARIKGELAQLSGACTAPKK